jgi:fructose-1,6-bisphosphatase/inositol monophosphatase family enzyme
VAFSIDSIVSEIRDAAGAFLRPRFLSLESYEVREKAAGEVVTVADEECEAHLGPALQALVPGSALIGEEAAAQDPGLIGLLSGARPTWLLDPLDGTSAFAQGSPDYAVMAALVVGGEIVVSAIHQPEYGRTFVAERGSGAYDFESGVRLSATPHTAGAQLRGAVMKRFLPAGVREAVGRNEQNFTTVAPRTTSAGIEYPAIARGEQDFMLYWRTLPWDHAPGALLIAEAGGKVAHLDGSPYRPQKQREGLLVAHTPELWEHARVELGI